MAPRTRVSYVDNAASVGQRLREAREGAGLSQRALSFPGCTPAYISRIEKGERVPSLQLLREFATRLGVAEGFLARGEERSELQPRRTVEARVALRFSDLETARRLADESLALAQSDVERADAFAILGEANMLEGDLAGARIALERALELDADIERRDLDVAEALGRMYARTYDYETAAAVFSRNRKRAIQADDPVGEVRFSSLLANAYVDAVNFKAAEEVLASAIERSEAVSDPLTLARMYWSQSRLHALQNDATNAARYAERALTLLEQSQYRYQLALAHQLLAHIELDRGNGERALELLDRAAPIISESGRRFEETSFRIEQARALLKLRRRKEAAAVAMNAAASMRDQSPVDAGRSYALIAEVFLELRDEARAIELFELAAEQLAATPNRYLVEVYAKLAELFEARGDEQAMITALKNGMKVQQLAERALTDPN